MLSEERKLGTSGFYRVEWRCGVGIRVTVLGRCKDVVTLK